MSRVEKNHEKKEDAKSISIMNDNYQIICNKIIDIIMLISFRVIFPTLSYQYDFSTPESMNSLLYFENFQYQDQSLRNLPLIEHYVHGFSLVNRSLQLLQQMLLFAIQYFSLLQFVVEAEFEVKYHKYYRCYFFIEYL